MRGRSRASPSAAGSVTSTASRPISRASVSASATVSTYGSSSAAWNARSDAALPSATTSVRRPTSASCTQSRMLFTASAAAAIEPIAHPASHALGDSVPVWM